MKRDVRPLDQLPSLKIKLGAVIFAAVAVWSTLSRLPAWVWMSVSCELIALLASVTWDCVAPRVACVSVRALCPSLISDVAAEATACWAEALSDDPPNAASIV